MKSKKKTALILSLCLLIVAAVIYIAGLQIESNTKREDVLFVKTTSPEEWIETSSLNAIDKKITSIFFTLRSIDKLKRGRYERKNNETLWHLVSRMRSGEQDPLRVNIDRLQTIEELCGRLGSKLYHDSTTFLNYFRADTTLSNNQTTFNCLPCIITPDEYEFYWTISPKEFLKKMKSVRDTFWNSKNDRLAESIHLSRNEVCILASIVKAETGNRNEAPIIAGLYLNRLKLKIPLQSDPTAMFRQRKDIKRVLNSDIEAQHEFNTYRIIGLPPGPICFVEDFYLESVLQPQIHNYLYMCAEPGMTGKHKFTGSYDEHLENAKSYHKWLDKKGT